MFKLSFWDAIHSPSDCCWSCHNLVNIWRWDKTFISNRWSAESFPRSMWVKTFNPQITFMYIHFSHYVNPPKSIVADIQKTFNVFYIYSFGQWFIEIKLKKLSIFNCEFVGNSFARCWYKMVVTPCSGTIFDFQKQSSRWTRTLIISSWFAPKNVIKGISLIHRSSIDF